MSRYEEYFNEEMEYLRKSSVNFARQYPKIASHLSLSEDVSKDPQMERLLESFAFLTSRIRYKIDQNFARMGTHLLEVLYPNLVRPLPPMISLHFEPVPHFWEGSTPIKIPKATHIYTITDEGTLDFHTNYALKIWPLKLKKVYIKSTQNIHFTDENAKKGLYLCLKFESNHLDAILENTKENPGIDEMLIRIMGSESTTYQLYQMIISNQNNPVYISYDGESAESLGDDAIVPMGFKSDETMLPVKPYSTHIYNLLQEFFHFPEKFMYFKIKFDKRLPTKTMKNEITIMLPIGSPDQKFLGNISDKNFSTTSTVAINLFETTSDPIHIDHNKTEYLLLANQRRDASHEIYDVLEVYGSPDGVKKELYRPLFGMGHSLDEKEVYYVAKRDTSEPRGLQGSDVYMSFAYDNQTLAHPKTATVFAHLLCSNRTACEKLSPNTVMYTDIEIPVSAILSSGNPSFSRYQAQEGKHVWKMISQLAVNHMSFADTTMSIQILSEILALYAKNNADMQIIKRLKKIEHKDVVRHFGETGWKGFARGPQITLYMEKADYEATPIFLFASIIRHFIAMNISINTFLEFRLVDYVSGNEIMTWKPLQGDQEVV